MRGTPFAYWGAGPASGPRIYWSHLQPPLHPLSDLSLPLAFPAPGMEGRLVSLRVKGKSLVIIYTDHRVLQSSAERIVVGRQPWIMGARSLCGQAHLPTPAPTLDSPNPDPYLPNSVSLHY